MEHVDRGHIAEKLDSLDTLPEGYTPNLASKWALLERSREGEQRATQGVYVWGRAAAVLLICFSLAFFFLRHPESEQVTGQAHTRPQLQHAAVVAKAEPRAQPEKKTGAKKRNRSTASVPVDVPDMPVVSKELAVQTDSGEDSVQVGPALSQRLVSQPAIPKKKKARYVQMDFGESDPLVPVPSGFYTHTRFKLFNGGTTNTQSQEGQTNSRPTHLSINF